MDEAKRIPNKATSISRYLLRRNYLRSIIIHTGAACVQLLNLTKSPSAKALSISIQSPSSCAYGPDESSVCFFRLNYMAPYMPYTYVLILHLCGGEWGAAEPAGVKHNSRLLLLSHNFYISARAAAGLQCNLQAHTFPPLASICIRWSCRGGRQSASRLIFWSRKKGRYVR